MKTSTSGLHGVRALSGRRTSAILVVACAGVLAASTASAAQEGSRHTGFHLEIHIADASWAPRSRVGYGQAGRGIGIRVGAGIGITPQLTAHLNGERARVNPAGGGDSYVLAHGDLDVRGSAPSFGAGVSLGVWWSPPC